MEQGSDCDALGSPTAGDLIEAVEAFSFWRLLERPPSAVPEFNQHASTATWVVGADDPLVDIEPANRHAHGGRWARDAGQRRVVRRVGRRNVEGLSPPAAAAQTCDNRGIGAARTVAIAERVAVEGANGHARSRGGAGHGAKGALLREALERPGGAVPPLDEGALKREVPARADGGTRGARGAGHPQKTAAVRVAVEARLSRPDKAIPILRQRARRACQPCVATACQSASDGYASACRSARDRLQLTAARRGRWCLERPDRRLGGPGARR